MPRGTKSSSSCAADSSAANSSSPVKLEIPPSASSLATATVAATANFTSPVKSTAQFTQSTPKSNRSPFPKIAELNLPPPTPSSASSAGTAKGSKAGKGKRHIKLEFESQSSTAIKQEDDESGDSRPALSVSEPDGWRSVYDLIVDMRDQLNAPVDTMGCDQLALPDASPQDKRFQTLVALMLSSQTKDPVTAAAMTNLHTHFQSSGGLSIDNILSISPSVLNQLISKVGFHNRKTEYIQKTAAILKSQYNGDIPDTIEGLTALPGVGPKMGYLALSCAWNRVEGIGVDVHVHRISNRLGWVKTKEPEQTRQALQDWLPKELWTVINHLLVGFGQQICLPVNPRCIDCRVNHLCEEGKKVMRKVNRSQGHKAVKEEEEEEEEPISIKREETEENQEMENIKGELSIDAASNVKVAALSQFMFKGDGKKGASTPVKQESTSIESATSPPTGGRKRKASAASESVKQEEQQEGSEKSPAGKASKLKSSPASGRPSMTRTPTK